MKALPIAIAALLVGCPSSPVQPATGTNDAATFDGKPVTCAQWCQHATALHCEAAKPTTLGASCEDVCNHFAASNIATWNLKCRVAAKTCNAADNCERGQ